MLALTVIMLVAAIQISLTAVANQPREGFSQLWILPASQTDHSRIRLGIRSGELSVTTYRLEVSVGGQLVHDWPSIVVQPNNQWETYYELPALPYTSDSVEARLYRLDAPDQVYRRVTWTVPPQ
jgi:hypothetical protein